MNHRLSATATNRAKPQGGDRPARQASTVLGEQEAEISSVIAEGDLYRFDPAAWVDLVEQQRRRIARAAGVDPAKVTIRLGH